MASTRIRILTLCASSLLTAGMVAVLFTLVRSRRAVDSVKFVPLDADAIFGNDPVRSAEAETATPSASSMQIDIGQPLYPPSTLKRRSLTDAELRLLYPQHDGNTLYDAQTHYRYRAHQAGRVNLDELPQGGYVARTNALGLRENREVLQIQPDLRVLVTGDSHTDGVCDADDTYTNVLERSLANTRPGKTVEALNAGVGGYSFYNYLGVLERYLPLAPDVFVVGVYGGNDFEEMLTLHHFFQGTKRPPGASVYGAQLELAFKLFPAIGQGFVSLKYFAHNPDQIDIALQGARDVSTEIVVTCLRQGIHPIFLYIPPMHSVEFEQHRQAFESVAHALQLSPDDMRITDRMADSYLAYLRSIHVDVVDMRPKFSAANVELYWQYDSHINVKAHELIADALLPWVDAACPPGATHIRAIGTPTDFAALVDGTAPGSRVDTGVDALARTTPAYVPETAEVEAIIGKPVKVPDEPLKPITLSREAVEQLFQLRGDQEYDARSLFRYASNLERSFDGASFKTNSSGLLGAQEHSTSQPNVLLLGDETVYAPGDEGATCGALIERAHGKLTCLDACTAGYGLFNYLGTLERLLDQQLVEVVVVVDTTTDVGGVMPVYRATQLERDSNGAARSKRNSRDTQSKSAGGGLVEAARGFHEKPGNLLIATRCAAEVVLEINRRCKSRNLPLTVVLLPPASDLRVRGVGEAVLKARAALGDASVGLAALSRLHASLLATLKENSVTVVDFGDTLAQAPAPLIDAATLRLNANGRAALAELIAGHLATAR